MRLPLDFLEGDGEGFEHGMMIGVEERLCSDEALKGGGGEAGGADEVGGLLDGLSDIDAGEFFDFGGTVAGGMEAVNVGILVAGLSAGAARGWIIQRHETPPQVDLGQY
jgi:hypothetical protein